MKRFFALIALFSIAHCFAAPKSDGEILEALKASRLRSAKISTIIGASIVVLPQFAKKADQNSKLFFSLGGVTVIMGGLKSYLLPGEAETIISELQRLRSAGKVDVQTERELLQQLAVHAESDRKWGAAISFVGGLTSVLVGQSSKDPFLKSFATGLGGLSMINGLIRWNLRGTLEKIADEQSSASVGPELFQTNGGKVAMGIGWNLGF